MTEYIQSERTSDIGDVYPRHEWSSVDAFEKYIRARAPKGKIVAVYGRGYSGDGGDLEPRPALQIIITTKRSKAVVDRELAKEAQRAREANEAAQKLAEEAAIMAAKKQALEEQAKLERLVELAEHRLNVKRAEIESFYLKNPILLEGEV